ncbi:cephalosporin deacetylase [Paenibacillus sp. H1-7]|uniref:acetylxylan esterase n=1 Tax=Paenibacillus sp. H1-7 TaxID=2282849 RepID=UPI001EF8C56A|nr:acetylxylan esterase [Paenibacillus sp. H1-7]ULL18029.1 cephalosporin deacetylase [Paenibacillus sp. H1-7]
MPNVDWPLSQLQAYQPELTAEADFDAFWERMKAHSQSVPLNAKLTWVEDYPVKSVRVYDVVYEGTDGTPVHGWYVVPAAEAAKGTLPVIVKYHGYNGNRGKPHELLQWAAMGMAAFAIDARGQGGLTPDLAAYPQGSVSGWMTLGILDPNIYYYRNVYIDCLRALDFVCSREEVDTSRIAVYGGSQGGGLALAAAGLDSRPKLAMPYYPYLCHFRRSVEMHNGGPYVEIKNWFRRFDPDHSREEQVYRTLSYFDGMNMASRVRARTLMAITLQDTICPPSTCFAAYNHLSCEKELKLYHDYGHEGLPFHEEEMMRFVQKYI